MQQTLHIAIAKPCHENWNNMNAAEKGRFCNSCSKEVIDFTQLSDAEILHIFAKPGSSICGRFTQTQLNTPIVKPPVHRLQPTHKLFLAAFVLVFLLFNEASAQTTALPAKTIYDTTTATFKSAPVGMTMGIVAVASKDNITGFVKDEQGIPVEGASIVITDAKQGTVSDANGYFSMEYPVSKKVTVTCSYVGMLSQTITVKASELRNLTFTLGYAIMGEVVVVTKKKKVKAIKPAEKCEKPRAEKSFFSVYPNPAIAGTNVKIAFTQKDNYQVQLIDINGQVQLTKSFVTNSKSEVVLLPVPANLVGGTYIVSVTGKASGKVQSEKIVLQR